MAELDDFGDFSSAFPPSSNPGGANVSLDTGNLGQPVQESGERVDFFAAFPLGETCPIVFDPSQDLDPGGTLPFDAFATCPADVVNSEGSSAGGLADFSQFNIADIPIPNPNLTDFNLEKGIFEIPPLPEELIPEAETDEKSKTGLFQAGQADTTTSNPGLLSSSTAFTNHTSGSFHAFNLSENAGSSIAPMATTSGRNGPISHKSSWPQSAPTDIRTTQSGVGVAAVTTSVGSDGKQDSAVCDDDDVFGDFESSFEQRLPTTSRATVAAATTTQGVLSESHSTPVEPVPSLRTSESHNGNSKLGSQRSEECTTSFRQFGATESGNGSQQDVVFNSQVPHSQPESQGDSSMTSKTDSNPSNGSVGSGTTAFTGVKEQAQKTSLHGDVNHGRPEIPPPLVKADVGGDVNFGAFQDSANEDNGLQTEFGSFATGGDIGNSRVDVRSNQSGGDFSGFQAFTSTTSASSEDKPDEFGDFGNFQSPASVSFASGNTTKDAEFGEFGMFKTSGADVETHEFGDFGAFRSDTSAKVTAQVPTGSGTAAREPVATTPTASAKTKGSAVKVSASLCYSGRSMFKVTICGSYMCMYMYLPISLMGPCVHACTCISGSL